MAVHIIKLCVGVESVEDLTEWQEKFAQTYGKIFHRTRMMPKRKDELLDGGSIYWVIKGVILVRQALTDIREKTTNDGIKRCDLILDPTLIPVTPTPRRAFQGWRYLRGDEAPADLSAGKTQILDLPPKMRADLAELCLI